MSEQLLMMTYEFRHYRLATIKRLLDDGHELVSTQLLTDRLERPDWLALIADVTQPVGNTPEAS